jgi:hypothetical protein
VTDEGRERGHNNELGDGDNRLAQGLAKRHKPRRRRAPPAPSAAHVTPQTSAKSRTQKRRKSPSLATVFERTHSHRRKQTRAQSKAAIPTTVIAKLKIEGGGARGGNNQQLLCDCNQKHELPQQQQQWRPNSGQTAADQGQGWRANSKRSTTASAGLGQHALSSDRQGHDPRVARLEQVTREQLFTPLQKPTMCHGQHSGADVTRSERRQARLLRLLLLPRA